MAARAAIFFAGRRSGFPGSELLRGLGHPHGLGGCPLTRLEAEFVSHEMPGRGCGLSIRHLGIGALFDLGDQFVLHAEHDIGVDCPGYYFTGEGGEKAMVRVGWTITPLHAFLDTVE
jgi:hypothetical protein